MNNERKFTKEGNSEGGRWYYNGYELYLGPRGGCFYYSDNFNKVYVDREFADNNINEKVKEAKFRLNIAAFLSKKRNEESSK